MHLIDFNDITNFINDKGFNLPLSDHQTYDDWIGCEHKKCNIKMEKSWYPVKHQFEPGLVQDMAKKRCNTKDIFGVKYPDFPQRLIPGQSTFTDLYRNAIEVQHLGIKTVEKHLCYLRFMEMHKISVDLKNPNLENFRQHTWYRIKYENAGYAAIRHEWDALKMLLRAYEIPLWNFKPPRKPEPHLRLLPFPNTVYQIMHYKYSNDLYETKLYQYIFTIGFTIGMRPPSELCALTIDDIQINGDGTGGIEITEVKKRNKKHTILPRKEILSCPRHKSFKNWIDHWRPKVENQYSGNTLFLWPSGKPVTVRLLGHRLSVLGKQVWPTFRPYDMRHWCAIARLIETKVENDKFDEFEVCSWLGHTDPKTTMAYIQYAKMYYLQAPYNWINRILKFRTPREDNSINSRKPLKTPVSTGNNRSSEIWEHWDLNPDRRVSS